MPRTGGSDLNAIVAAGYPYELAGIFYYALFLMMGRKRYAGVYSRRSRFLVVLAAIVMVGCVPFHYAATFLGATAMFAIAGLALLSTLADAFAARRR
jgi:4-amino-4-deoxy-L-arabinose transferase-like glycosyltransferase